MKKFTLLLLILVSARLSLKAQDSYNFAQYGVAAYFSAVHPFDDLKKANNTTAYSLAGYYNYSPYVPIGLELQFGNVSGGSIITDPSKRQYDNKYTALIFHADLQAGELIDYSGSDVLWVLKDFYVGTGFGFIYNNMAFIQRTNLTTNFGYSPGTYTFPGSNSGVNTLVPIRFGYEFKLYNEFNEPYIGINIGYVHNITFGEGLDGYVDPPDHFKNNSPDQYRQIVIGVKFNFGLIGPYTKTINR